MKWLAIELVAHVPRIVVVPSLVCRPINTQEKCLKQNGDIIVLRLTPALAQNREEWRCGPNVALA